MLRTPLAQPQSLTNNGHTYQQIPLFNHRSNEGNGLLDTRTMNNNGVTKKLGPEPPNDTLANHPSSSSGFELNRTSDSSLAASVTLVQQNSSQRSAFETPSSNQQTVIPNHVNGSSHNSEVSQLYINHGECRSKYDRLLEAHRKLQRTNGALEGRLLQDYYSNKDEWNIISSRTFVKNHSIYFQISYFG